MLKFTVLTFLSFVFTFAATVPFINFMYKYNIKRISEENLSSFLPGKKIKLGTPIMGGAVIVLSVSLFAYFFLRNWEYRNIVIFISLAGGVFGAIDEYTNALGRSLFFIRRSREAEGKNFSFFPVSGFFLKLKRILLIPWRAFEEAIRVMGSNQKGLKNHHKLLMYSVLLVPPIVSLYASGHGTYTRLPFLGAVDLGIAYYFLVLLLLLGFGIAFGITDGMDGLSAGAHSISFLSVALIASYFKQYEVSLIALVILGSELAFLYFNFKPARIQMSDVGTLPLGFLFAFLLVLLHLEFALFFIGAIYLIEILSSVLQQWSVKLFSKRLFYVAPIHHHFESIGWEESKVVERLWLFTAISSLMGLIVSLL